MKTFDQILNEELTFNGVKHSKGAQKGKFKDVIVKDEKGKEIIVATISVGITHDAFNKIVSIIKKEFE